MRKIRVAIVGVGNCASALIQGLAYYGQTSDNYPKPGMITPLLGGYGPADIEVVTAFDVVDTKVGLPINQAIWAQPNNTTAIVDSVPECGKVYRGPTLDGLGKYLREVVGESTVEPIDVEDTLALLNVDVLVSYLPVGSDLAAQHYAGAALRANTAFVNCMPAFIASDPEWAAAFKRAGVPIIGDDIKSQVGATIVHRTLVQLLRERGYVLRRTSQLNVGGNSDFLNMLERSRLTSKKISKTRAVTSIMGVELPAEDVHIGPSDYVPWLGDTKVAHIRLEAEGFGGAPLTMDLKLEVVDSPNSAGVVMDAIRCAAVAQDRGQGGPVAAACAWYMKSPPEQWDDSVASDLLDEWLRGDDLTW
jgi:myo-inositol-1-phosphate synthase